MREYALIMMNMINYAGIYLKKTECWICKNSECVWCSTSGPFFPKSGHFFRFSKRAGETFSFLSSLTHEVVAEFPSISLNIPKYSWKRLNKQFWLYQGSKYSWSSYMLLAQDFEDASGSKWSRVPNMARLYMQELRRIPNIFNYDSICLSNS